MRDFELPGYPEGLSDFRGYISDKTLNKLKLELIFWPKNRNKEINTGTDDRAHRSSLILVRKSEIRLE